jgi:hypothetical protein
MVGCKGNPLLSGFLVHTEFPFLSGFPVHTDKLSGCCIGRHSISRMLRRRHIGRVLRRRIDGMLGQSSFGLHQRTVTRMMDADSNGE